MHFIAEVDGREVFRKRTWAENRIRWRTITVPINTRGEVEIAFRGEHVRKSGAPMPASESNDAPWVALGAPRIHPGAPRPGRVFVWISVDTLRADHLGAYGYERDTSPNFDRLSRDWAVFEDAVAPSSWTLPTMASAFCSQYPIQHGAVTHDTSRDRGDPTLFQVLGAEGFCVLGITANEFISETYGTADGFDVLRSTDGHAGDVNRLALEELDEWAGGDLALFVHYIDPHYGYNAPKPLRNRFLTEELRGSSPPRLGAAAAADATPAQLSHLRALYDGEIAYTDLKVGELLEELRARGLLEHAVVVFSADHGEEFLEHGGFQHGRTLYQELLRVPFAVGVPGIRGRRVQETVSLVDLAPTVLDAFDIEGPASFRGRSLLPMLRGSTIPDRPVYAETEWKTGNKRHVMVRDGSFKYIVSFASGTDSTATTGVANGHVLSEELFDIRRDAREVHPLTDARQKEAMQALAAHYLSQRPPAAATEDPRGLPPIVRERLRALGYVE